MNTVYLVDDDDALRDALTLLFESVGYECQQFADAESLLVASDDIKRGVFVLDIRMPGMSGRGLFEELKRRGFEHPTIFLSGHADIETAVAPDA